VNTARHKRQQWNQVHLRYYSGHPPFLPHPPPGEKISEHQSNNLIWPNRTPYEQIKSKHELSDLPWQQILSRKLMFYDNHRKD